MFSDQAVSQSLKVPGEFTLKGPRCRVDECGFERHRYQVVFEAERPQGIVELVYSTLEQGYKDKRPLHYAVLRTAGLSDGALIAEIADFFPNGRRVDDRERSHQPFMRNGVGSAVFACVAEDCREAGVQVLYVYTQTVSMRSFLTKHGFTPFQAGISTTFYKALAAPPDTGLVLSSHCLPALDSRPDQQSAAQPAVFPNHCSF